MIISGVRTEEKSFSCLLETRHKACKVEPPCNLKGSPEQETVAGVQISEVWYLAFRGRLQFRS